jgi:hypothetical protein
VASCAVFVPAAAVEQGSPVSVGELDSTTGTCSVDFLYWTFAGGGSPRTVFVVTFCILA